MVSDYLFTGAENARTGRELAEVLCCDLRDITAGIENERRRGLPIIATCDPTNPGYYLAASAEELQHYCDRLNHRASEINKTRRALLKTAKILPARREA